MKDGGTAPVDDKPLRRPGRWPTPPTPDKTTIDVEAKNLKS
jgi:hypothetical protein